MASEIKMPQLGLTMTEGTVTQWFNKVGESVAQGELLFEVATDKITNQIEATASGILLEIRVAEGKVAPVQSVVGIVGAAGEAVTTAPVAATAAAPASVASSIPSATATAAPATTAATAPVPANEGRVKASPAARKMAEELGVDLAKVTATRDVSQVIQRRPHCSAT